MEKEILQFLLEFREEVNQRFEQVDKRFEQIEQRFEQVDKRFEQMEQRFDQVDKRFEEMEQRFEHMDKRFERSEGQSDQHGGMIQQLINIVGSTNKKVDALTDRVDWMQNQLDVIAAQQTDVEYAHQRITKNERNIAKIKAILLGEIN